MIQLWNLLLLVDVHFFPDYYVGESALFALNLKVVGPRFFLALLGSQSQHVNHFVLLNAESDSVDHPQRQGYFFTPT